MPRYYPNVAQHTCSWDKPGLEKELLGLKPGAEITVEVSAEEGYGEYDTEAVIEVPLSDIPEDAREVGSQLETRLDDGTSAYPIVVEVGEETITLDFNHPLAGEALQFEVKILSVEQDS